MTRTKNRQITLASRPNGAPTEENFRLVESGIPTAGEGQMLLRTLYLSLDPYMRGRMNDGPSYAEPVEIGGVMTAGTVCQVVDSQLDGYRAGDIVLAGSGWQDYALSDGEAVRKLDPAAAPLSYALGVLGMPGFTAYVGLLQIGQPKAGETVVVSAASGAVGSVVGQIAKIKGCRAVGIAGSPEKCAYVTDVLGFDVCLNYKDAGFAGKLAAACPDGIDVYYENVGGEVFQAVLPLLNTGARVPVCGLIAHYNATSLPEGPDRTPLLMRTLLTKRIMIRGFIIFDHYADFPGFLREMSGWLKEGRVQYREDQVDGLENASGAFMGLLVGRNFGKLVVKVADPS
jgi:hypothetical protein